MVDEGSITAEAQHIWPLLRQHLYANREVFVRELLSNAVDALDKVRLAFLKDDVPGGDLSQLQIDVRVDRGVREIAIADNGIGMTYAEVQKYINQMAVSGVTDFVERHGTSHNMIGCFGVGFYSAFLVASTVTIETKSWMKGESGCRWVGTPDAKYRMDTIDRQHRGTTIAVSLADDSLEFLDSDRIEALIRKYCDFVPYPILLNGRVANTVTALWHQPRGSSPTRAYEEFYKRLFGNSNQPRLWIHLQADYPVALRGILYVPFMPQGDRGGIRLFCKRICVDEDFHEATVEYLSFLRGVLDVEGVPLNLPREKLHDDTAMKTIRAFIVRKVADEFARLASERREDFTALWTPYEKHLKIGAMQDKRWLQLLSPHFLFASSRRQYTTIGEYLERNRQHGTIVYYATDLLRQRAYLDTLQSRNMEALYMTGELDLPLLEHLRREIPELAEFRRVDFEPVQPRPNPLPSHDEAEQVTFCRFFECLCSGMGVTMECLEPTDPPVVLRRKGTNSSRADLEDFARRADIPSLKELGYRNPVEEWQVVLNADHALIETLMEMHGRDRNDHLLATVCETLYRETTVKFGLADENAVAGFLAQTEILLAKICQAHVHGRA